MDEGLHIDDVTVRYRGLCAVSHVSMTIGKEQIHGLIGPNGAGKTSLINCISGLIALAGGRVLLDGQELQTLSASRISAAGIGRTFQHAETFADLTVLENVATGAFKHRATNWLQDLVGTPAKARAEREVYQEAENAACRLRPVPSGSGACRGAILRSPQEGRPHARADEQTAIADAR